MVTWWHLGTNEPIGYNKGDIWCQPVPIKYLEGTMQDAIDCIAIQPLKEVGFFHPLLK